MKILIQDMKALGTKNSESVVCAFAHGKVVHERRWLLAVLPQRELSTHFCHSLMWNAELLCRTYWKTAFKYHNTMAERCSQDYKRDVLMRLLIVSCSSRQGIQDYIWYVHAGFSRMHIVHRLLAEGGNTDDDDDDDDCWICIMSVFIQM